MKQFTIQVLGAECWQDIATLDVLSPEKGRLSPCRLGYEQDYAIKHLEDNGIHAVSLNCPVRLFWEYTENSWFPFLEDLIPSGAARRVLVRALGLANQTPETQDFALLERGVIAPVGNLRFKEAIPEQTEKSLRYFPVKEVVERQADFLEYASQMGAISGGATGASGEAPKLLLRCSSEDQVFIDTFQDQEENPDGYFLVKFPRNDRSDLDCDVLRAEYDFYQELHQMGVSTISTIGMRLEEGSRFPSLWLPRFDALWTGTRWKRLGMESLFSILKKPTGTHLSHFEILEKLIELLRLAPKSSKAEELVSEWLCRDLLNVSFGNSDNHGRNSAILKTPEGMKLSPVFDFAPMRADPGEVIRTTTWGSPLEMGGEYRWQEIAVSLAHLCDSDRIMHALRDTARKLEGLRERLKARGVPQTILQMPSMGFDFLDQKLKRWGLL